MHVYNPVYWKMHFQCLLKITITVAFTQSLHRITEANCVCTTECSCHVYSFDCGVNYVSHIWPDVKFNGKANGIGFAWTGATAIKLWTIL